MSEPSSLALSSRDRERMEEVQRLAQGGAASTDALVRLLDEPSWVVRRAVVASLAQIGAPAVHALAAALAADRSHEARIAATVDALVASSGDVDGVLLAVARGPGLAAAVLCDIAQILGRRKSRAGIDLLGAWCSHVDDNVAVGAIEALGRIGGDATVPPLVAGVMSGNFFRVFAAISVLGQTGDPRAVPALVERLREPLYAAEATAALGRTGQLSAVEPLTALLVDGSDTTRVAARALADLRTRHFERSGDPEVVPRTFAAATTDDVLEPMRRALAGAGVEDTLALAGVLGWKHDATGVGALVALLDGSPAAAQEAFQALRGLAQDAEPLLRDAVRTGDSARRQRLLPLLGARRSVVPELVACLDDADPGVRAAACEALGRIGDTSAVEVLFGLIGDADARVAQAALGAIQSLGSDEARTHALATARSPDPRRRRAALRIVAYFGYPEGLDVLLEAIVDPDEKIRDAAAAGLVLLDHPRALAALVSAAANPVAHTRASTMRSFGLAVAVPEVVQALTAGLGDEDAWVRYYACQSLGKLHVTALAERVGQMVDDEAGQVRVAAVEAAANLGGARALAVLDRASRADDPDVRRAALVGLGSLKRPDALPILLRAADAADATTRLVALTALAESPSLEVTSALARAGSDVDPRVRDAAFALLATRPGAQATRWLIEQLSSDEDRERALRGLTTAVDGRIEGILGALESADATLAQRLVDALSRMRRAHATAAIEAALQLENVAARRAAATALLVSPTTKARQLLVDAARLDSDPEVRRLAGTVL